MLHKVVYALCNKANPSNHVKVKLHGDYMHLLVDYMHLLVKEGVEYRAM